MLSFNPVWPDRAAIIHTHTNPFGYRTRFFFFFFFSNNNKIPLRENNRKNKNLCHPEKTKSRFLFSFHFYYRVTSSLKKKNGQLLRLCDWERFQKSKENLQTDNAMHQGFSISQPATHHPKDQQKEEKMVGGNSHHWRWEREGVEEEESYLHLSICFFPSMHTHFT